MTTIEQIEAKQRELAAMIEEFKAQKPAKLWVATWFDSGFERGVAAWCSSDKNEAMRYSARPGFKLHELDCGVAP